MCLLMFCSLAGGSDNLGVPPPLRLTLDRSSLVQRMEMLQQFPVILFLVMSLSLSVMTCFGGSGR